MDFEEMKVIWDSQNEQPLYVLDQEALHASVRRKGQCIETSVNLFEGFMIGILLAVAGILVGTRLIYEPEYNASLFVAAALTIGVAAVAAIHLARGRVLRRRREQDFEPSLLGDINKAISQVDYQVSRLKTFHLWFILPTVAMTGLNFVMKGVSLSELFGSKIWIWPLFLASFALYYWAVRFETRRIHGPRKRSLEALREKLVTAG